MYLLGVLCLVAFTTALPVIPEPPSLPGQSDVTVHDSVLHTNLPIKEDAQKGEHEEKKDENEAEPPQVAILSLPEPPKLPPFDESILVEMIKQDEKEESKVDKENKVDDSKTDDHKNVDKQISMPTLSNMISSLSNINWPISFSSIKWPPQLPSFFTRYPRIVYPGYYIEEVK